MTSRAILVNTASSCKENQSESEILPNSILLSPDCRKAVNEELFGEQTSYSPNFQARVAGGTALGS